MNIKTTVYKFTFDSILRGGQKQLFLNFPGRYGSSHGPFASREEARKMYDRVLRECFFLTDLEKEVAYEERTLVPVPYVPPTDYQI